MSAPSGNGNPARTGAPKATPEGAVLERLLRLLQVLRAAPDGLTEEQLAGACGVSPATVRGDLEVLAAYAKVPVWNEADDDGNEGDDDWRRTAGRPWHFAEGAGALPPVPLTPPEAWALLEAVSGLADDSVLRLVGVKLREALLGRGPRERQAGNVLVKGVRPVYDAAQPEERLHQLEKAVHLRRRLRIAYRRASGEASERKVDPYGLLYYWVQSAWYLVGHCHLTGEVRTFRVDRLTRVQELPERFACPADFCLEEYFRHSWGVDRGELHQVMIRFWDHFNVLARVRKETAHRREANLTPEPGGTWLYTDVVAGLKELRVWVRSFGESAEVLAPQELRDEMRESAQQILQRYGVQE
ncbi:MAG: helix-turn-helix transcriptional regulator [Chitinophagales bacterium]